MRIKAKGAGGSSWTEGNLQQYLDSPDTFVPNGVMAFAGVKNEAEVKDLIAFLKTPEVDVAARAAPDAL